MQAEGVVAVGKHFPGHGDVSVDAHFAEAIVNHPLTRLHAVELKPFRAAVEGGVAAIMTAHVRYTALDEHRPATLSSQILTKLLREELGFTGVIVTDAMDMESVAQYGPVPSISAALDAGADLILLGHLRDRAQLAARFGSAAHVESVARIAALRQTLPREMLPFDLVGCAEHQAVAREIAERSITLVRDSGRLPLALSPDQQVAVVTVRPTNLTPADTSAAVEIGLDRIVRERHPNTVGVQLDYGASIDGLNAVLDQVRDAAIVIVGTIGASGDPSQVALVQALTVRGQRPIIAALRTPYDLAAMPAVETYMCTYGIRRVSIEALVRVLFGDIPARGILPCTIPSTLG